MPPPFHAAALKASPHAELECVACHSDIKEVPHPEKLARVDCGAVPPRRADAVCRQRPRQEGGPERPVRSGLQALPRHPRYPGPVQPEIQDVHHQRSATLRTVPCRGRRGQQDAHHVADQHHGELPRQHSWGGPFPERSDGDGGLHQLPQRAQRPAAQRSALVHRQAEHRQDLHEVPCADRERAPPGDPRRVMGKAAAPDSGVRGLPRAPQGPQGLLLAGHVQRRLPELPLQSHPEGDGRGEIRQALRERQRTRRVAPLAHRLRAVPHRRDAVQRAGLQHHPIQGGLLHLS